MTPNQWIALAAVIYVVGALVGVTYTAIKVGKKFPEGGRERFGRAREDYEYEKSIGILVSVLWPVVLPVFGVVDLVKKSWDYLEGLGRKQALKEES